MTRDEFFQELAAIYDEWVKDVEVEPDPRYSGNDPSQYAETMEAVSAAPDDEARYWAQVSDLNRRYRAEHPLRPSP